MTRARLLIWSIRTVGVLAATASWAGPITFSTAITLSSGEFVVREQAVLDRATGDPGSADRTREVSSLISVLGYGIDQDITVFGVLPFAHKQLDLIEDGERRRREDTGVGDVRLFGRYNLVRRNWRARAFRLAAIAGIETPTGEDDETDRFGRLPADIQLGSGSWDPFGGLVATYQTLDFQVDSQLSYQANTEANDFEFGDVARADASLQFRLWPRKIGGGVPAFVYGVIEANLIHKRRNRSAGGNDANSGGTTLDLVPGLQYVGRRWIFEAAVQVPAVQNLNGTALEKDVVARAGFRVNF